MSLPSEAQWEYGCRAGTTSPHSCAREELSEHANLADQAHRKAFKGSSHVEKWDDGFKGSAPVGSLAPNGFGLHDLHGNQLEWCRHGFKVYPYTDSIPVDPVASGQGITLRVVRGGGWAGRALDARSARRRALRSSHRDAITSFRPAREVR